MIFFMIFVISCSKKISKEVSPYYIKISGPMADRKQEISGMDWYEDNLFLLPENLNGYVFLIKKSELESRINKTDSSAITPQKIKFKTPDYKETIPGFDSFEAIAFRGYEVYRRTPEIWCRAGDYLKPKEKIPKRHLSIHFFRGWVRHTMENGSNKHL